MPEIGAVQGIAVGTKKSTTLGHSRYQRVSVVVALPSVGPERFGGTHPVCEQAQNVYNVVTVAITRPDPHPSFYINAVGGALRCWAHPTRVTLIQYGRLRLIWRVEARAKRPSSRDGGQPWWPTIRKQTLRGGRPRGCNWPLMTSSLSFTHQLHAVSAAQVASYQGLEHSPNAIASSRLVS
ncbi:predicted protein [Plenodomus lingam JN3]|uniref:Predicted protein n=1 Tax=Leptosphaeria maculans (strain JN3 / isolate v23.1.3 / race Av1-4-5-6-7-8) TaxID=985895 RepID=E4ZT56_LEPMJ|nr:predicted protein [Plenodomus lingam JN3]CBX94487.1 predicted protein [Plenodomus lingam JN3]